MTWIDDFQQNILNVFSYQSGKKNFVLAVGDEPLRIFESEKSGKQEVFFRNAKFIHLSIDSPDALENIFSRSNQVPFHKISSLMKNKCDGVFLANVKGKLFMGLVELKLNIRIKNFKKLIEQIEISYYKISMLLGLLENPKKLHPVVFAVGRLDKDVIDDNDPDSMFNAKNKEFSHSKGNEGRLLRKLERERRAEMYFPFFVDFVNRDLHREGIPVYHLNDGDSFNMQSLLQ